ncbi:PAS domain S-box protein [Herpetosiphon llansteffanensis]
MPDIEDSSLQTNLPAWMRNGGIAGASLQQIDWNKHALGPMEHWPSALQTALSMVLSAAIPMALIWSATQTIFYNDQYLGLLDLDNQQVLIKANAETDFLSHPLLQQAIQQANAGQSINLKAFALHQSLSVDLAFSPIYAEHSTIVGVLNSVTNSNTAQKNLFTQATPASFLNLIEQSTPSLQPAKQLQPEHERLSALIGYVDRQGYYRFNNQAYQQWFQRPLNQITGSTLSEVWGEAAYQQFYDHIHQALLGQAVTFETVIELAHDQIRSVAIEYQPDLNAAGEVQGFFSFINDLSSNKKLAVAVQESQQRFNALFQTSTSPMIITRLQDGLILDLNESFIRLLGYQYDQLINQPIQELNIFVNLHDRTAMVRILKKQSYVSDYELEIRTKDNQTIFVICSMTLLVLDNRLCSFTVIHNINNRKIFERKLQESEERLKIVIENLNEGIVLSDVDGNLFHWNRIALSMHGFASMQECRERLPDFKDFYEISTLDDQVLTLDQWPMSRLIRGENLELIELKIRRINTSVVWERIFCYGGATVIDSAGHTVAFLTITDITKRKQVEKKLQYQANLLAHVSDAIISTDSNYTIKSWNRAAEEIYGWPAQEAIGKRFSHLVPTEYIYNDTRDQASARLIEQSFWQGEVYQYTRNGQKLHMLSSVSLIKNTQGQIQGTVGINRDITAYKQATQALQESEQRFRTLTESLPQLIWTCSIDGSCDYLSQQWVQYTGISEAEQLGLAWIKQIHPDDQAKILNEWSHALNNRQKFHSEYRIRRHDNTYRWFDTQAVPFFNQQGEIIKWFGASNDIDDRKRAEDAQLRSQKMEALGTLAGGIAHDFNNILLAITGNTQLAMLDLDPQHPVHNNLREIEQAGERATDLVRQILTFSRQQEVKREVVLLPTIIDQAVKLLRATLPALIEIQVKVVGQIPATAADPTQIFQIIMNLATNAAHAIGNNRGLIEIRLDLVHLTAELLRAVPNLQQGHYVRLSVSDNGCGMEQETIKRIFDPFFTTKPLGEGTGLGLSVVDGIMKNHDGAITVYSQMNKGSTFRLYFPTTNELPTPEPPKRHLISESGSAQIVYIDDDQALVSLAIKMLTTLGYTVQGFTNPQHALEYVQNDPNATDIVISDVSMPHMSGFDLAQQLHIIKPNLPIILTSGYVRPEDYERAQALGIHSLILKPHTYEDLGYTLAQIV